MPHASQAVFTIGHSSRTQEAFLDLLTESRVCCVVDVRKLPGSDKFPHFNADNLDAVLPQHCMQRWRLPALCGRRSATEVRDLPAMPFWRNASFARYASWARGDAFAVALDELVKQATHERCALMCAEAVWWRCHRRIITDHLLARGIPVRHIIGPGQIMDASLTRGARVVDGLVVYPSPADDADGQ